jgi:hypothetical protein
MAESAEGKEKKAISGWKPVHTAFLSRSSVRKQQKLLATITLEQWQPALSMMCKYFRLWCTLLYHLLGNISMEL